MVPEFFAPLDLIYANCSVAMHAESGSPTVFVRVCVDKLKMDVVDLYKLAPLHPVSSYRTKSVFRFYTVYWLKSSTFSSHRDIFRQYVISF